MLAFDDRHATTRWGLPIWGDWPPDDFNRNRRKLPEMQALALVAAIRAALAAADRVP